MLKRIITSIVAVAVLIPVLIFSNTWIFPAAIALCAVVGCYEMLSCIGQKKNVWLALPIYLVAALCPVFVRYFYISGQGSDSSLASFLKLAIGLAMILALYIFGVAVFDNKRVAITDSGLIFASCFYIIAAFTSLVYLRDYVMYGMYIYLLPFICAWVTDIFAYFIGRFLGKHKLIPSVSPKKTVEGAIGGIVFCVIALVAYGFIIERFVDGTGTAQAKYLVIAISGVFVSVVSQTGDLIMSVIKRHYGIKDYGKIFPGHGGILDRFDSVMAVSVILAFICTYFNLFA